MRLFIASAFCLAIATTACAQDRPGTRLTVDLSVSEVKVTGDTLTIEYALRNRPESLEPVFTVTLDAPVRVLRIWAPQPDSLWYLARSYRGRSVAEWGVLGDQLLPGDSIAGIGYSAVGVVGWVDGWIGGYTPPPRLPTQAELDTTPERTGSEPDPLFTRTRPTRTLGIVARPQGGTQAMLTRLGADLDAYCAAGTFPGKQGICQSLRAKLQESSRAFGRGQRTAAVGVLGAFINEVTALPAAKIESATRWLLIGNAKILRDVDLAAS